MAKLCNECDADVTDANRVHISFQYFDSIHNRVVASKSINLCHNCVSCGDVSEYTYNYRDIPYDLIAKAESNDRLRKLRKAD